MATLSSLAYPRLSPAMATIESINRVRCQHVCFRNIDLERFNSVSPSASCQPNTTKCEHFSQPRPEDDRPPTPNTQARTRIQQLTNAQVLSLQSTSKNWRPISHSHTNTKSDIRCAVRTPTLQPLRPCKQPVNSPQPGLKPPMH